MAIITEDFSATPTSWQITRGTTALSRVTSDNSGSILANTTNNHVRKQAAIGGGDMFVECDVVAAGGDANRSIFLSARHPNDASITMYALFLNRQSNTLRILKYVSGTSSEIGTGITNLPNLTIPFKIRLETEGTAIRAYAGGVLRVSTTDTSIGNTAANGYAGLGFYNAGTSGVARIDNWRAGLLDDENLAEPGRHFLAFPNAVAA